MKNNLTKTLIFLLLLSTVSHTALAHDGSAEEAVLSIEKKRIQAMLVKDWVVMDQIMAEDCIHITTDGSLRTKSQYMRKMLASVSPFSIFLTRDTDIRVYDDVAIASGHYENAKKINGKEMPTKYGVFTRVYQKRANAWKLISHQATVDQNYLNSTSVVTSTD